jgi:hypothetical protein
VEVDWSCCISVYGIWHILVCRIKHDSIFKIVFATFIVARIQINTWTYCFWLYYLWRLQTVLVKV